MSGADGNGETRPQAVRGRGAISNPAGRFARTRSEREAEEAGERVLTELRAEPAKSIIARNRSPDVPFTQSINMYRGCEHGCIYCFARPTHAYLDLSPGRDFETRILFKPNASELLRAELAKPGYEVSPIALGTNTDPYQPAERDLELTRGILEVLAECKHPVSIVTKSGLILRDLDILVPMAAEGLAEVMISVTTLDPELKRRMEPRTAGPARRLAVIRELNAEGVPAGVLAAPVIPALNDHELERIVEEAAAAGAVSAGYVLLRLPHEVGPLFTEWLEEHYPERARHVLSLIEQMRAGRINDPRFHSRQRGEGPFAALLRRRFERACRAVGIGRRDRGLDLTAFRPPRLDAQLDLFR